MKIICPICFARGMLCVMTYVPRTLWYRCPMCLNVLCDEDIHRLTHRLPS